MWKIIKKSLEKVQINKEKFTLGMKWQFRIDFANDSFGPYNFKFEREDCYFSDWLEDRGTKIFPLRNKAFDNTEIFLENDDIVIAVWERWSLMGGDKSFIDIINIKTEKKYRLFTDVVNLIFNSEDKIIINAKDWNFFKTLVLDINTLEKIEEVKEQLQAFFKCVYNKTTDDWYLLDFNPQNEKELDEEKKYQNGSFILQKVSLRWEPTSFNRREFKVKTKSWEIDIWEESIK